MGATHDLLRPDGSLGLGATAIFDWTGGLAAGTATSIGGLVWEPLRDDPTGGGVAELRAEQVRGYDPSACQSIADVAVGRVPLHVVNPGALEHPRLQEVLRRNRQRAERG